jgi:hypothetical protein
VGSQHHDGNYCGGLPSKALIERRVGSQRDEHTFQVPRRDDNRG